MSLSAKRESLARIHGRYQRAGRPHKSRILEEFCATCGYHRKAALRLLNRPLRLAPLKRSGPKLTYDPLAVLPVLKTIWLASDQLCSKLLRVALPAWLEHHERRTAPLPEALRKKLLQISSAQIDRLLRPARVQHPKKGICATRPGTLLRHEVPTRGGPPDTTRPGSVEADTVAHCDDSTEGDYVHSLTFTELFSGWTENRAVWNKSAQSTNIAITVFFGLGDGKFAPGLDYPAGVKPAGVAIGDLNGDGWPDVVTANFDSNGYGILWNRGIACGVR